MSAIETDTPGKIHFDVAAWWPGDRLMVAYKGHLELVGHGEQPCAVLGQNLKSVLWATAHGIEDVPDEFRRYFVLE